MELDTGAAVTLISEATCHQLWPDRPLQECITRLCTYAGEQIQVLGQLEVAVQSGDQHATLPLLVVQVKGASLLSRDWLHHIKLDWQEIHRFQGGDTV